MKREVKIGKELFTINVYRAYTDKEAAAIFNVELQDIYDAIENNPGRFANGLVCKCTKEEPDGIKMLFPEKGICMLATVLRTKEAEEKVLSMIEAYVGVKGFVEEFERAMLEGKELEKKRRGNKGKGKDRSGENGEASDEEKEEMSDEEAEEASDEEKEEMSDEEAEETSVGETEEMSDEENGESSDEKKGSDLKE